MHKDDSSELFTLEDIIKEFGSGDPAPTPAAPAPEEKKPVPRKGKVPFQTTTLPKITPEMAEAAQREADSLKTRKAAPKPGRKARKSAKAAERNNISTKTAPEQEASVENIDDILQDFSPSVEESSVVQAEISTPVENVPSKADQAVPGMVNLEELTASVAAAAVPVEPIPEPDPESIVEKMPDPVQAAEPAPEPPAKPRPTRRQAADQSAAELGLMSDAELDAIIQEFSDEPSDNYRQQDRLAQLEKNLREDLRSAQPSDFFEEQFGGYAGPQPEEAEPAPVEESGGFLARLKKMMEEAPDEDEEDAPDVQEPTAEAPKKEAQPKTTFNLQIPADAEPGVPFTVGVPAPAEPEEDEKPPKARKAKPATPKPEKKARKARPAEPEPEEDDEEEFLPLRPKKVKQPPVEEPPLASAREGCQKYGKPLKQTQTRVKLSGILAFIAFALTGYYSLDWQFIGFLANGTVVAWVLNILLVLSAVCCMDIVTDAIASVKKRQFPLEALVVLAALAALIDGILAAFRGRVPYCATASVLLWMALWGRSLHNEALYRTFKVLDKTQATNGIVRSENVYRGKAALFTADITEEEFLDHIRKPLLSEQVLQIYTPLAALLTLILALVAAIRGQAQFLQSWTPMLLAAVPAAGLLCYGRAFAILAKRLAKRGAALCGWYGACALGNNASVLLRDEDLFPRGMMEPNGVKSFHGYTGNQVVAYAAAVLGKAGSGLAPVLDNLLERDGGRHYQADAIRLYENGGIGGKFGNDAILVGTLGFMRRMGVHMTAETKVKRATYVSVNGELAGLIAIRYGASAAVKDALGILTRSGRTKPVLATCNISITPKLLKMKFHAAPERFDFPDLRERAELAARSADPDSTVCAIMAEPHIATFADAAVGGRILQTVVKVGLVMAIVSGLIGICVLGVLSLTGAIAGLSASYLLLFDLIWLIPVLLLTGWTRNY